MMTMTFGFAAKTALERVRRAKRAGNFIAPVNAAFRAAFQAITRFI
jgi:hypothetical protein